MNINSLISKKAEIILALFLLFCSYNIKAQYEQRFTTAGTFTVWTVPNDPCITEYTFEVWGGGANGADAQQSPGGGAGGYARVTVTGVTPNQTFTVFVGGATQASYVINPAGTTILSANGATGQAGAAGTIAIGSNPNTQTGGNGANSASGGGGWASGGGGGAGGAGTNGGNSTPTCCWSGVFDGMWSEGGAGKGNGGSGGRGGYDGNYCPRAAGLPGQAPGGGGGGGDGTAGSGGAGSRGEVRVFSSNSSSYTIPGTRTWTAPAGVTKALVTAWGGGGQGGACNVSECGGAGGGGGGEFAQSIVDVAPGNTYTLVVGAGGAGGGDNGANGGVSWFSNLPAGTAPTNATQGALANGGQGGQRGTAAGNVGAGGTGGIGQSLFAGGAGGRANGLNYGAGGGGGAAGSIGGAGGPGGNATNTNNCSVRGGLGGVPNTSGNAKYTGAVGSEGETLTATVKDANQPGGGGGGIGEGRSTGGLGGDGMVLVEWPPLGSLTSQGVGGSTLSPVGTSTVCTGTPVSIPIHGFTMYGDNSTACNPILVTGLTFTTSGTYLASDIVSFSIYTTTTPVFATTNLVTTTSTLATAGNQTFPAFNLPLSASNIYVWIVANISATAGGGRTISVNATDIEDLTISTPAAGSAAASGVKTFIDIPSLNSTLTPSAICSGNTFSYTPTSSTTGATFAWQRAVVAGITPATSSAGTFTVLETLSNGSSNPINALYSYTTAISGCSSVQTVTLTVNPLPIAGITGDNSVCSGNSTNVVFSGSNSTAPYIFTYNINGITTATVSGSNNATVISTNPTSGTNTYSLLSVSDVNTCTNTANGSAVINVRQSPTASISGATTVCKDVASAPLITFQGGSTSAPYSFVYSINGASSNTITTSSASTNTTTAVPVTTAQTYTYTLISVQDQFGCSQNQSDQEVVVVNPLPTAFISGTETVCQNSTKSINFEGGNSTAPYIFTYRLDGGATTFTIQGSSTQTAIPINTATAGSSHTVTLVSVMDNSTQRCSQLQSDQEIVIVKQPAVGDISTGSITRICLNDPSGVNPSVLFTGSVAPPGYTFTYTVDSIKNGVLTGTTTRTVQTSGTQSTVNVLVPTNRADSLVYTITGIADNSGLTCPTAVKTLTFIIDPLPRSTITSPGGANQCFQQPGDIQLDFRAINVIGQIKFNFTQQFGADYAAALLATPTTPTNSPLGPLVVGTNSAFDTTIFISAGQVGTTIYSNGISSSNVCTGSGSGSASITVNPLPTASISVVGSTNICDNTTTKIRFTGAVGQPPFTFSYNINGASNKTISSAAGTYTVDLTIDTVPGTYSVNLTAVRDQYSCTQLQTDLEVIRVDALPQATPTGTVAICLNLPTTISGITASNYSSLNWTKSAAGTLTNIATLSPSYTPVASDANTVVTLTMTATGTLACSAETATTLYDITVYSLPTATLSGSSTVCQGTSPAPQLSITSSSGQSPYTINYTQDGVPLSVNSASTNTLLTISTAAAQTYTHNLVSIQDANGCSSTLTVTPTIVRVNPSFTATVSGTNKVCQTSTSPSITFAASGGNEPYRFVYSINGTGSYTLNTDAASSSTVTTQATGSSGVFTYSLLSVEDANNFGCGSVSVSSAIITVDNLPKATISGSRTICEDGSWQIPGASVDNATPSWSDNGVGNISTGALTLAPTYTASSADANNQILLTLTATSINTCSLSPSTATSTATYTIHVDHLPVATAISSGTVMCSEGTYTLQAGEMSAQYGSISWSETSAGNFISGTNSLTPIYEAALSDANTVKKLLMTVTGTTTGCLGKVSAPAEYTVQIDPLPEAQTSGFKPICQDNSYTLLPGEATQKYGSVLWTENSAGSFEAGTETTLRPKYIAAAGDVAS